MKIDPHCTGDNIPLLFQVEQVIIIQLPFMGVNVVTTVGVYRTGHGDRISAVRSGVSLRPPLSATGLYTNARHRRSIQKDGT